MYNPIKIYKAIVDIYKNYGDEYVVKREIGKEGEHTGDGPNIIYDQLRFPAVVFALRNNTRTDLGKDVMWGRKHNDKEYVENVVIPKLMDFKYLEKLNSNTVGAGYYQIVKKFGIQELYDKRFKENKIKEKGIKHIVGTIRANISRHILLTHDIWHTVYGYKTDILGESMLQVVTARNMNYYPARVLAFLLVLKISYQTKDKAIWKVYKEAKKLAKQSKSELAFYSPIEFLESKVEDVRKKFNVQAIPEYNAFEKRHHNYITGRALHPQYKKEMVEKI